MHLPFFEHLLWAAGAALKVLLCVFAFYRRLYRRLPWFTLYLALLPGKSALIWWAYHEWGNTSTPAWYLYWISTGVVLLARGVVIAEICRFTLALYPGLWSVMRKLLILAASMLLAWAGIAAARNATWIVALVLTAERGLEIAASVILLLLYVISVSYGVWLESLERKIVFGLALYSVVEMLNSTFMAQRFAPFFPWWESVRIGSFDLAMVLWLIPLLRSQHAPAPATPLLTETAAAGLLRQLLFKMRELTNELKRVGKALRK